MLVFFAASILAPANSNPAARPAAGTPWTLVWNDEFDAASCPGGRPDPKKWGYEHGMVRNHEAQWYQPDNAACQDGKLVITAERVTPSKDKGNAQYTSSSLVTQETAQWMYGRMEMRGKIDVRSGSWPAWWTLGNDTGKVGWPECGEVDIMEYYRTMMHGNIMYSDKQQHTHWSTKTITVGEGWAASFHNWSMYWDPTTLSLYLDGKQMNTISIKGAAEPGVPNPFQQKVYMILNQAIGGSNGGDPSTTTFPLRFEVDYVRVYQGGSAWPPAGPPPPPSPAGGAAACRKQCGGSGKDGCCMFTEATGSCDFHGGWHVQGGGGSPGTEAANCYASGSCDGWNQDERCHQG